MKKNILIFTSYVVVAVLASFLTLLLSTIFPDVRASKLDQLSALIEERFIGEADMEALEDSAAAAMIAATGDRWSYYIPASEYTAYQEQSENAYVGVGITIQEAEGGIGFSIISVTAEGPSAEVGVLPGDLLIKVDDQDVRGFSLDEVKDLVKGKEGTYVTLTLLRSGDHRDFTVERRKILTPVTSWEMLEDGTGLVTILNFDERCAQETIHAIQTLMSSGATKIIFDVRYNPGGYASELVELLDYLLPEGDLFRTVNYKGDEVLDRSGPEYLDIPMAVLVNGSSYSAAEFFAAALQEYNAAVIIGQQTSGKGRYQTTFHFTDGSAAALSIGNYFTPNGANLEGIGVIPDISVTVDQETASAIYYGTLPALEDPYVQEAIRALAE